MGIADTTVVNESHTPDDRQEQILEILKAGRETGDPWGIANPKYITEQTDLRRQYVNRALGSLVDAGWVRKPVKGLYIFVADPREEDG